MQYSQTKTTRATWLGQAGEVYDLLLAGKDGPRVVVHRWLEDGRQGSEGDVIVRAVKGNQNRGTFEELDSYQLTSPNEDEVWAAIEAAKEVL